MSRHLLLTILFLLAIANFASAAVIDDLRRDFAPLDGVVIMPSGNDYLLDLDASKGVRVGDLFAVIKPGEKVVHPVTGEVLGTLDQAKGLLRVTRLEKGFSFAEALPGAAGIGRGDAVRRYAKMSAALWDYTGQGETFLSALKSALPALDWQPYAASQAARPKVPTPPAKGSANLIFVLRPEGLEVRDASFAVLRAYTSPSLVAPAAAAPYRLEEPAVAATPRVRYEASFPGFQSVGNLPWPAVMADLARDGERLLLAATDGKEIRIFSVGEELTEIARGGTGTADQVLSVRWWQPSGSEELRLAVNTWTGTRPDGNVFTLKGGALSHIAQHLPYTLGAFDRDGDGKRELLLGQGFDDDTFWGIRIEVLSLKGDRLSYERPDFFLPRRFTVQGSSFADLTGDGRPETVFVRDGLLYIYDGKKEVYKSPKQMGGSLSVAAWNSNPTNLRDPVLNYARFEVPPLAADLDGDSTPELLAVASDRPIVGAPGLSSGANRNWIAVLKWRDRMFVKGSLGEELEFPLQALGVYDGRVLFVATEPSGFFGAGGGSHLLSFPLGE